ncbi:acyl carrier protein [Futiania mangrovi]|uniref:Acyl carrier protein n=1 Tax=Futiania mangrovi TaxID=2959716 RepID=A0A9J6PDP7_9PROT|nr:phosphopantetheine-binding protein [Futiania mangrovii]MCP1337533.1 acyl carrier protein [Futiania mangrovii]
MTRDEIRTAVVEEVSAIAPDADLAALDPSADMREAIDLDSMDVLNLLIALHKRLGIDIPEEDAGQLVTLGGAVDYLAARAG